MPSTPPTRASLLLRLRDSQDQQAWEEFVEIYQPLVYRLARSRGFQDADADELSQEVLLAVSGAIDRFRVDRSQGSFRGWLFRIARNLMINFLAHQKRHPSGSGDTNIQKLLEEMPARDDEHTTLFERECRRRVFQWAAEEIRGSFRPASWQAFWRTCVEADSVEQTAKELGMSVGAVYVARSRVMAKLKKTIQKAVPEEFCGVDPW